jgi:hypothetical protein
MAVEEFARRNSVELDKRGFYVVEEISEDEELPLPHPSSVEPKVLSINGGGASPSSPVDIRQQQTMYLSPSRVVDPIRREFGNISPIPEDFSGSDKEVDETNSVVCPGSGSGGGGLASSESSGSGSFAENSSLTSVTAEHGGGGLLSRLNNCSSPILAHSPSLRKTPVQVYSEEESAAAGTSSPRSGGRRVRNLARALDDISDREEDSDEGIMGTKDSDDEDEAMDLQCCGLETVDDLNASFDEDEEKTESFEIDLNSAGDGMACLSGTTTGQFGLKGSESCADLEFQLGQLQVDGGSKEDKVSNAVAAQEKARTVWETLSENIETHMSEGNNAGFVAGPIDHPIHVSKSPEPSVDPPLTTLVYSEDK